MEAFRHTLVGAAPSLSAAINTDNPKGDDAVTTPGSSCRNHTDAGETAAEECLAVSDPAPKRPRRDDELRDRGANEGTAISACFAAPIPHSHASAPVDLVAVSLHVDALRHAVQQITSAQAGVIAQVAAVTEHAATAEVFAATAVVCAAAAAARAAAAEEAASLQELERAVEASHPAVPALVRAHSQLYRNLSDGGGSESEQPWAHCLLECPVQPRERCLDMLALLSRLQQAPEPPVYRVFHVLSEPLFDCLEHAADADLADMQRAAEYLQLPKPLVARVAQHAEARSLRLANTSPAALPAALQLGALSPLVNACLAAAPQLVIDPERRITFRTEAAAYEGRWDYCGTFKSPAAQQQALLADPCFLQGLCGAPCAWLPGCEEKTPRFSAYRSAGYPSVHLTGLLLAGHPLPTRLHVSDSAVAAAVAVGNDAALKRLMASCTGALEYRDLGQSSALNAAATFGRTDTLEWLLSDASPGYEKRTPIYHAVDCAAAAGHMAALQLLLSRNGRFFHSTAAAAASGNHLSLLQFLRAAGCPWNSDTLAQAAAGGHQELIEWAVAVGCPHDARACAAAATAGNLLLLQWLREHGFPWDVRCYVAAAEGRHLDIMRYLREHGCDWGTGGAVCEAAAFGGSLELLQWCIENGATLGRRTCDAAAAGGHLDVLMYAHGYGCEMNELSACAAAAYGHAACLAWIFENDGSRLAQASILKYAKQSMQVECVKLAVAHGCKEDGADMEPDTRWLGEDMEPGATWAGESGNLELVRWLTERAAGRGDGSDARVAAGICTGAARRGQLQVLELMLATGQLDVESSAPAQAAAFHGNASLATLEWLFERGVRFDARVFENAARACDIGTLEWLRDVAHCRWDHHACVAAVRGRYPAERLATLQWCVRHGCLLSPAVWEATYDNDVRKWLCVQPDRPWDDKLVLLALRNGDTFLAWWALANEPDAAAALKTFGCEAAIAFDDESIAMQTVRWVRAHGGEWSDACSSALATGEPRFDLVELCVNDGCGAIEAMFLHAISNSDVGWATVKPHLRFLRRKGCPWSAATVAAAASRGWRVRDNLVVVRWLLRKGCPCDASACAAAARASLRRLKDLHDLGAPLDWSVCVAAARAGRLDSLQWAHSKGCPLGGCADIVVFAAPVREWLLAQGVACRGE